MTLRSSPRSAFPAVARRLAADARERGFRDDRLVTLLWFVIWLICDLVGDREPLLFDPVNIWTGTLLAAVALDLARGHASAASRS